MTSPKENNAHDLYKLYWAFILPQCIDFWEVQDTKENRERLHESHKKIYGCKSIAGQDYDFVSDFITEIVAWYAIECGLFLRTSQGQPDDIADRFLEDSWDFL